MEIKLPADCGNAPRVGIVGDFAVNWAKGDAEAISEWLAGDVIWTVVGSEVYSGVQAARYLSPPVSPERLEIISVVTHGRLASCDGYLEGEGKRIDFSHALRFASTSKSAKIAEARSYCIQTRSSR